MKITKANLLERIEALENENKQRGIGNQFMTLKCIQGNRHFTKDATYCASKLFDRTVITTNFGSRKELTVNTNIFGGYKATGENQTAVFQVIGADVEPEPQLKQLDQSVFKEWADCWKFFATDEDGDAWRYREKPKIDNGDNRWSSSNTVPLLIGTGYDASNWQNSLIERDTAKELAEVDLSSELTGSELCKAMLARGDKYVMCLVGTHNDAVVIEGMHGNEFVAVGMRNLYRNPKPINNQGEPLTASEVGL